MNIDAGDMSSELIPFKSLLWHQPQPLTVFPLPLLPGGRAGSAPCIAGGCDTGFCGPAGRRGHVLTWLRGESPGESTHSLLVCGGEVMSVSGL